MDVGIIYVHWELQWYTEIHNFTSPSDPTGDEHMPQGIVIIQHWFGLMVHPHVII